MRFILRPLARYACLLAAMADIIGDRSYDVFKSGRLAPAPA